MPRLIDQMWKSSTTTNPPSSLPIDLISFLSYSESIDGGAPSINTLMHLLIVGVTVTQTMIEKMNVHIGSARTAFGKK